MIKVSVRIIIVTCKFWFDDWVLILSQKHEIIMISENHFIPIKFMFLKSKMHSSEIAIRIKTRQYF